MHKILENIKIDENLTTNVLILFIYFFFLFPDHIYTSCWFCLDILAKQNPARCVDPGVVTARLDTFGMTFYFFFPYLFFQPTASLFFLSPEYLNYTICLLCIGYTKIDR